MIDGARTVLLPDLGDFLTDRNRVRLSRSPIVKLFIIRSVPRLIVTLASLLRLSSAARVRPLKDLNATTGHTERNRRQSTLRSYI